MPGGRGSVRRMIKTRGNVLDSHPTESQSVRYICTTDNVDLQGFPALADGSLVSRQRYVYKLPKVDQTSQEHI